jgi:hypothetical protein
MLAILMRVLLLVACGPLLVPPGICVCKAGVTSCTADVRATVEKQDGSPVRPHSTACCSHRHDTLKIPSESTQHGEPTTPVPAHHDDHTPGCPAGNLADRLQSVEPTTDTTPVTVLVTFADVVFETTTGGCNRSDHHVLNWPCSPPLYLTHCCFVI